MKASGNFLPIFWNKQKAAASTIRASYLLDVLQNPVGFGTHPAVSQAKAL
jgi:hypothetical protein